MASFSYIKAIGDQDYNFGYNDFTVEFFAETSNVNSCQTLFEITNNESQAAYIYSKTRFLTVLEYGNINAYALQESAVINVSAHTSSFTSPITINANYRLFYDGQLLNSNQYSVSGSTVTLSNIAISPTPTQASVDEILFSVNGNVFTENELHFVSTERYGNSFYLFLDGVTQANAVPSYYAIPTQYLANTANANANVLNRVDSPALLTIGANRDGDDPFYGKFGDIKIVNGTAIHASVLQPVNKITSWFNEPYLGTLPADIIVDGGNFVDSTTSYGPEELVNGQMFDTLFIQTYQSSTSNSNANILSFILFKPMILAGPIGSYSFILGNSASNIPVPWTFVDVASASILVNGNAIASNEWEINKGSLSLGGGVLAGSNIEIIVTGPTNYYVVGSNTVSNITANVYANSTSINVANVAGFASPTAYERGQVFINQECITYSTIDRTNNILSGLVRGNAGTGVPNIHASGSRIICAGYSEDIQTLSNVNPRPQVWYATPFNNTSLQNTQTTISNVLLAFGGIPPLPTF